MGEHSAEKDAPENDHGWRVDNPPTSFLARRDQRPTLSGHKRSTANRCQTCGTAYPCEVRRSGPQPTCPIPPGKDDTDD